MRARLRAQRDISPSKTAIRAEKRELQAGGGPAGRTLGSAFPISLDTGARASSRVTRVSSLDCGCRWILLSYTITAVSDRMLDCGSSARGSKHAAARVYFSQSLPDRRVFYCDHAGSPYASATKEANCTGRNS